MSDRGIIYLMRSISVQGIVKIGKTENKRTFHGRMQGLETNGYRHVVLKGVFAIKVDDYHAKEKLLHEIFEKSRVGDSELFAIDETLVLRLMSSLQGTQIYPEDKTQDEVFDEAEVQAEINEEIEEDLNPARKKRHFSLKVSDLIEAGVLIDGETLKGFVGHMDSPASGAISLKGASYKGGEGSLSGMGGKRCLTTTLVKKWASTLQP